MITKHAVVLAIILGTASVLPVTKQQQDIGSAHAVYGGERLPGRSSAWRRAAVSTATATEA
jgi:hypothetical protein